MRFVGSKGNSGLWQRIISEMPRHSTYVEAFLGTGYVMRKKRPAVNNIGIDADPAAPGLTFLEEINQEETARAFTAICGDAISQLAAFKATMGKDWLVYCDPPYLASVRSNPKRKYYTHEFNTEEHHLELLGLLRQLPCNVMISGYSSRLYNSILSDWRRVDVPTITRGHRKVVECVWCNFPPTLQPHDIRFLGKGFRDRERIKRKKQRWIKRLQTMHATDRIILLDAINELSGSRIVDGDGRRSM